MLFVRSFWDPIKISVSTEETCVLSFFIFKNFSRRTIKAQNIEIDEGKQEISVSTLPKQRKLALITY
jgi:hypothetical protein